MIKVTKYIYVHFTTVIFFVVCWFTRKLELLILTYLTVFLHETAHLFAAMLIGAEPSRIILYPFGVNLRLKNTMFYELSEEILLYMSGPLFNAIAALSITIFKPSELLTEIYWINIGLFLFNILPIEPMDGGIVLKRILTNKFDDRTANKTMKLISSVLIFFLIIAETELLKFNKFNFSVFFAIIFLTANIFTNKSKYDISLMKKIMYIKNSKKCIIQKTDVILADENIEAREIAKRLSQEKNHIIFRIKKNGKISKIVTEYELINEILDGK